MGRGAMRRDGCTGGTDLYGAGGILNQLIDNSINWGEAFYFGCAVIAFVALCAACGIAWQIIQEWDRQP